jgi:hypothetical protein
LQRAPWAKETGDIRFNLTVAAVYDRRYFIDSRKNRRSMERPYWDTDMFGTAAVIVFQGMTNLEDATFWCVLT